MTLKAQKVGIIMTLKMGNNYDPRHDGYPEYGYFDLFRNYTSQFNIIDSLFYCCIFLKILLKNKYMSTFLSQQIVQNLFIFYRNFSLFQLAERFYENNRNKLKKENYMLQKLDCAYFQMLLLNLDSDLIIKVSKYLDSNIDSITFHKEVSARPWLALLYNIKYHYLRNQNIPNELDKYINIFESLLNRNLIDILKAKTLTGIKNTKQELINALIKIDDTRYKEDLTSELFHLIPSANRLITNSISNNDIEGFLIGSIVTSDSSINFKEKLIFESNIRPLIIKHENKNLEKKLSDYCTYIKRYLKLTKNQICLWVFENQGSTFYLIYDVNGFSNINKTENWSILSMKKWLKDRLNNFEYKEYNETPGNILFHSDYSFELENLKEELSFTKLKVSAGKEILYIPDIEVSVFPHNLIQDVNGNYLSSQNRIANILTIEYFIENSKQSNCISNPLKISSWIPIDDKDFTILSIYDKLKSSLDGFQVEYHTNRTPSKQLNSNINIFVGHGNVGLDGFNTVYTNENTGLKAFEKVFGRGEIAILFICHSGSINKRIFRHQITSLVTQLIEFGYKSVIGSFWSLYYKIPDIWVKEFLDKFTSGHKVIDSVFLSNKKVSKHFILPSAWAAMHLFGNPNIKIKN